MRKTCLILGCVVALSVAGERRASAVVVNVALNKPTSGDAAFNFATGNGNDGNLGNFTHADNTNPAPNNPFWMVDLQGSFDLDSIVVYDRNGCCTPNRFNGSIITVLDAGMNLLYESDAIAGLPDNNTTDLTRTFDNGGAGIAGASFIRVDGFTQFFQFAELEAFADVVPPTSGNLALFGTATQSTLGFNLPAINAIDGNLGSISHTASDDLTPSLSVDLGDLFRIEEIVLNTRTDCCTPAQPERDYNLSIEVLDASGAVVFTNPLINPWDGVGAAPDLGVGASFTVDLSGMPGGGLIGRSVRVSKASFGGTASEWLAVAELEVNGSFTPVPEPSSIALLGLAMASLMLRRTRRRDCHLG